MRKTASGRWVPDRPALVPPDSRRMGGGSYEEFLFHRFTHAEPCDTCLFCQPPQLLGPSPWGLLGSITLDRDARRP